MEKNECRFAPVEVSIVARLSARLVLVRFGVQLSVGVLVVGHLNPEMSCARTCVLLFDKVG